MEISTEQIDAFFRHRCSQEEATVIGNYLKENPDVLDEYLSKNEWNTTSTQSDLPASFWDMQWEAIEERRRKKTKVFTIIRRYAAAVILLLIAGSGAYYFYNKKGGGEKVSVETIALNNGTKTIVNNTGNPMRITLPDSSTVELQPNTEIVFKEFFEIDKRDVYLKGDAIFKVARDKNRPFTVHSGAITTTALGTKFRVVYKEKGDDAKVFLYEGKVVVKVENNSKKASYLLPGDELSYIDNKVKIIKGEHYATASGNTDNDMKKLAETGISKMEVDKENNINTTSLGQGTAIPTWYRFEKESLANVFDQLSSLYNVEINYSRKSLQNKYFIGKFERTESIEEILKTITDLNQLELEKISDGHYQIK